MIHKITSVKNDKIIELVKLNDKKYISDSALVESEKVVLDLIRLNLVQALFIEERFLNKFEKYSIETYIITKDISKKLSNVVSPCGIYAKVFLPKPKIENTNFVVLDTLQDPTNVGAIFRTALATNFKTIYLIDSVCPYLPKVTRGSMGYNFQLNIISLSKNEFIKICNEQSFYLISANLDGKNIFNYHVKQNPFGIVIGNEGNGVSNEIQNLCSDTVSIPMQNNVESLNAVVSASLFMYLLK